MEIKNYIEPIISELEEKNIRIYQDWADRSPGYKFNEWEMKGVPLRIEVGLRDIENANIVVARRDSNEKIILSNENAVNQIIDLLEEIQKGLFDQAKKFRDENTHTISSYDELKQIIAEGGFVRCGWDGTDETEAKVKEETKATIRCIPMDENPNELLCVYSGKPAKHEVIYAKAY